MPWGSGRQIGWAQARSGHMGWYLTAAELEPVLLLLYHRMGCWQLRGRRKPVWR